jgi:hypothetical protein
MVKIKDNDRREPEFEKPQSRWVSPNRARGDYPPAGPRAESYARIDALAELPGENRSHIERTEAAASGNWFDSASDGSAA